MTNFLRNNYIWLIIIGIALTLYITEKIGRASDIKSKNAVITDMLDTFKEEKEKLIVLKDSSDAEVLRKEKIIQLKQQELDNYVKTLNRIRNERTKIKSIVPALDEHKLDSIISNYRHQ